MYERLNMEKMDGSRYPPAKETIWNHLCYEKTGEANWDNSKINKFVLVFIFMLLNLGLGQYYILYKIK